MYEGYGAFCHPIELVSTAFESPLGWHGLDLTLLLREQNRQGHFGGEHASGVVAAQRDDGDFVRSLFQFFSRFPFFLSQVPVRGACDMLGRL